MSMRRCTEGIVLKSSEYGEADLIVTYASPDAGVIQAFAKSPRKIRSRFGSSLEPLTHARIGVLGREGAVLPRLVQSDIIHPFNRLRGNLDDLLRVAELAKLYQRFSARGEARPRKFGLFLASLHSMESTGRVEFLAIVFTIKLLWMSGYGPRLDTCGRCHRSVAPGGERYFYPSAGSAICSACVAPGFSAIRVSPKLADFFRDARGLRFADILSGARRDDVLCDARILLEGHCSCLDSGLN